MVGALVFSCTDLNEEVIDEVIGGESSNPESAMAAAYGQLANRTFTDHGNVFGLQEYPTDECMLPTRGSDWGRWWKMACINRVYLGEQTMLQLPVLGII
ncbi:putative outer membrane protein [Algibacter lectus]|uniref:Putative outer membrane protein n=2 Tax=Algibacter lectus TaxID=221126 RepID=A0A090WK70_9FLAO|nr:putative outer membrane protein [Algibacter lectus]